MAGKNEKNIFFPSWSLATLPHASILLPEVRLLPERARGR